MFTEKKPATGSLNNAAYWERLKKQVETDGLSGATVSKDLKYDTYGNTTQILEKINNTLETVTTDIVYGSHGSWIPGSPTSTTITSVRSGKPAHVRNINRLFNNKGFLLSETDYYGQPKAQTTTHVDDPIYGVINSTSVSCPNLSTRTTSFAYDAKKRYPTQITNPLGQVKTISYDYRWGQPVTETDFDGLVETHTYDAFGRVSTIVTPEQNTITQTYNWSISGNYVYNVSTVTPGRPNKSAYYDMMGRKIAEQADNFLDVGGSINTLSMTYDNRGNVKTETLPHYNGQTDKVTITYNYDNYNRLQSEVKGFGTTAHTTTYAYAYSLGNTTVTQTDPAGYVSSQTMDAAQKLVTAIDYGGTLTYEYNSIGNQTKVKYNGSDISTMGYDIYGRQTSLNEKNSGLTTYEYNGFGELSQQTNANGHSYTFAYDLLGRTIQRIGAEGTTEYQYHSTGNGKNRIKKIIGFNGINEDYFYDNLHRITLYQQTINGVAYNTSYTYNNFNDVATITYPSGFGIRREYDNNGYLHKVKNLSNTITLFTGTAINAFGQYRSYTLGNGANSTVSYTPYGQPSRYQTSGIQDLTLNFNLTTGNLTSRYDALKNRTESFQYDNLYRLKSSQVTGYSAYQVNYSDNGNISNKSDAGLSYTYHTNKINAVSGISSSQNISLYQQDIVFTPYHQPEVVTEQTAIALPYQLTYTYGPDHERRKSVLTQGASTLYTRLYLGEQENNTTIAGTQNIHYISGGNGLCAVVVRQNGVDNYYYVYTDHLGSILTLTNASGVVAAEQNFDAWGRKRNPTTWHYSSIPTVPSWLYRGYTGHEDLNEFKLINMNGRLYDPVAGRMLSVDNYVQAPNQTQSYNRYSYVHNNPLRYTDPSGEIALPGILVGAVIGGVINGVRHIGQPQGFIKGFVIGAVAGAVAVATFGVGTSAVAGGGSFLASTSATIGSSAVSTAYSSAILGVGNMAAFGEPYSHDQWVRDIYIGAAFGAATGFFQYLTLPKGYGTLDLDEYYRYSYGGTVDDLSNQVLDGVDNTLAGQSPYSYGTGAANGGMAELSSLNPTHYITKSESVMKRFVSGVKADGAINESILFVENNGSKFIVDGHHRFFAAQKLGIQNVPVQQVQLPFRGYQTTSDLILSGKQPGWWKFYKP